MEDPNSHLKRIMNRYVFDVNQPLGFGTNSIVYVGTDETNNTKVAIKKLNKNIIQERISGEVEALKRCTSPYVVKIIAVTKDEDNVYLMTELCTGGDLKSQLSKFAQLPMQDHNVIVKRWISQLIVGYRAMFDAGLMHRDIKPENLLLTNSNFHTGDLKYADFGLAQYANMATTNCGTEYYKAPEVQENVRYDYRADLWSIGVVIYELAIGKNPFIRCKNNVELHAVQKSQFLNNEDYVRYGDSDIKMIIEHLLQYYKEKRASFDFLFKLIQPWINHFCSESNIGVNAAPPRQPSSNTSEVPSHSSSDSSNSYSWVADSEEQKGQQQRFPQAQLPGHGSQSPKQFNTSSASSPSTKRGRPNQFFPNPPEQPNRASLQPQQMELNKPIDQKSPERRNILPQQRPVEERKELGPSGNQLENYEKNQSLDQTDYTVVSEQNGDFDYSILESPDAPADVPAHQKPDRQPDVAHQGLISISEFRN